MHLTSHRVVENNLHWLLDAIFDEDYDLVRLDNDRTKSYCEKKITIYLLKQVDFSDGVKSNIRTPCLSYSYHFLLSCRGI